MFLIYGNLLSFGNRTLISGNECKDTAHLSLILKIYYADILWSLGIPTALNATHLSISPIDKYCHDNTAPGWMSGKYPDMVRKPSARDCGTAKILSVRITIMNVEMFYSCLDESIDKSWPSSAVQMPVQCTWALARGLCEHIWTVEQSGDLANTWCHQ